MKEHENRHAIEQWPIIPKVYEGEILPPEKEEVGNQKKINLILMEINNIDATTTTTTNPIHVTYVTHVEAREKDIWEQIGEDMVDVAMFIGPPLIRGAKYLYNRYQRRCLPEPRPAGPTLCMILPIPDAACFKPLRPRSAITVSERRITPLT